MAFSLFQFLHVLTMFGAVAAALISEVVLHYVGRTADLPGIRSFLNVVQVVARFIPVLFVVGAIFGFITAITGGIDLTRPWLLASYVVFVVAMATGATVGARWARGIGDAAFAAQGTERTREVDAAVRDRAGTVSSAILLSSIVVIVFLMVVKPGG